MKRMNTGLLFLLSAMVLLLFTVAPLCALGVDSNGSGVATQGSVSRAAFVDRLYRAVGGTAAGGETPFLDVPADAPYREGIIWAARNEVVSGVGGGLFAPNSDITREQAAAMLLNYARSIGAGPVGTWAVFLDYSDVADIADWAFDSAMYAKIHGLIDEKAGRVFDPKGPVTQTEADLWIGRLLAALGSQTPAPYGNGGGEQAHERFVGEDIAVVTGVLTFDTTKRIGANPVEYPDSLSAVEAVRSGRVAGFMHALTLVQVMADELGDAFAVVPIPFDIFSAQIGGFSHDQAVVDRFDAFLGGLQADGTLETMQTRWFGDGRDLSAPIPVIANTGENGVIRIAICSDAAPYVFVTADGTFSGYSVELALRFGAYEGKTVVFSDKEFAALLPSVSGGEADFGIANVAITEERRQSVLFTAPILDEGHGVLVMNTER